MDCYIGLVGLCKKIIVNTTEVQSITFWWGAKDSQNGIVNHSLPITVRVMEKPNMHTPYLVKKPSKYKIGHN